MPVDTSYPMQMPLESFPIIALWEAIKDVPEKGF